MNFDESLISGYWHLLAHRSELGRTGDFIRFQSVLGDIVLFNDGLEVVAFDNRCPHRGALMFSEFAGNRPAICPYHGWSYRAGKLFVAQKERFSDGQLAGATLRRYRTAWVGDLLFVGIAPRVPLEQQIAGVEGHLETISRNIVKRIDCNHYGYDCYWPIAVENALEPYHLDAIHPQTLAALKLGDGVNVFRGLNSIWSAPVENSRVYKQLSGMRRFFDIAPAYDGYESLYLFPFTMISSTFGYSYSMQHFLPWRDRKTFFSSRLLVSRSTGAHADGILDAFFASTARVNRTIFEEDHAVCSLVPADAWTPDELRFSADSERKIAHFRQSCREHLAAVADRSAGVSA
jgi:phenylpropionate dioxygenase-like ring-hydroxylating dioxygenase large terminal subunit